MVVRSENPSISPGENAKAATAPSQLRLKCSPEITATRSTGMGRESMPAPSKVGVDMLISLQIGIYPSLQPPQGNSQQMCTTPEPQTFCAEWQWS